MIAYVSLAIETITETNITEKTQYPGGQELEVISTQGRCNKQSTVYIVVAVCVIVKVFISGDPTIGMETITY